VIVTGTTAESVPEETVMLVGPSARAVAIPLDDTERAHGLADEYEMAAGIVWPAAFRTRACSCIVPPQHSSKRIELGKTRETSVGSCPAGFALTQTSRVPDAAAVELAFGDPIGSGPMNRAPGSQLTAATTAITAANERDVLEDIRPLTVSSACRFRALGRHRGRLSLVMRQRIGPVMRDRNGPSRGESPLALRRHTLCPGALLET
jgi:hypothetical protein